MPVETRPFNLVWNNIFCVFFPCRCWNCTLRPIPVFGILYDVIMMGWNSTRKPCVVTHRAYLTWYKDNTLIQLSINMQIMLHYTVCFIRIYHYITIINFRLLYIKYFALRFYFVYTIENSIINVTFCIYKCIIVWRECSIWEYKGLTLPGSLSLVVYRK